MRNKRDRLLGRRPSTGVSVSVPLQRLDEVLRSSGIWTEGLGSAVVALTGPVAEAVGFRAWLTAVGVVMGGSALLSLLSRDVQRLRRTDVAPAGLPIGGT